jgi:drug/metabolite transporter, DME family
MSAVQPALVAARHRTAGLFHLTMSGLMLGTGGLTGRLLTRETGLSPVAVAGYRLALGGLLIVGYLVAGGGRAPRGRAAWVRVAVVGALAAAYQACYFASAALTSVSLATLVAIGALPVLVAVLEGLAAPAALRRRADPRTLGAIGLALAGLGLLVGVPSGGFGTGATLASAGLAIGAAGGFAAVSVLGARPVPGLGDLATTGFGFALGGLVLLPVAGLTVGVGFRPGASALGLLLALAIVPTAVAYTLYFRGLRSINPVVAAVMTLLEPLTGAVLSALVLGDRLGPAGLAGAVLLASAVVLAAARPAAA